MKFLCVKCDSKMKLRETSGPDETGSLAAVFECESCKHEVAMLTNAHETQLVSSLGVTLGGADGKQTSTCPFTKAVSEAMGQSTEPDLGADSENSDLGWSQAAKERLEKIPEFVRPMAKVGIEDFAKANGYELVDEKVLDEAKGLFAG